MDYSEERAVFEFICRGNIKRFRELLSKTCDLDRRECLRMLLAVEEAKLQPDLIGDGGATGGYASQQSYVNAQKTGT